MEAIICAVITGVVTLVVSLITTTSQHSKNMTDVKKDLQYLTKAVEKHNDLVSRTYKLEEDVSVLKEKMSVANHRIDDLEGYHKGK